MAHAERGVRGQPRGGDVLVVGRRAGGVRGRTDRVTAAERSLAVLVRGLEDRLPVTAARRVRVVMRVDAAAVTREGTARGCRPREDLDGAHSAALRELGDDQGVAVLVGTGEVDVTARRRAARIALEEPDADIVGAVVLVLLHPEVLDQMAIRRVGVGGHIAIHDVDLAVDVVVVVALPPTVADA